MQHNGSECNPPAWHVGGGQWGEGGTHREAHPTKLSLHPHSTEPSARAWPVVRLLNTDALILFLSLFLSPVFLQSRDRTRDRRSQVAFWRFAREPLSGEVGLHHRVAWRLRLRSSHTE